MFRRYAAVILAGLLAGGPAGAETAAPGTATPPPSDPPTPAEIQAAFLGTLQKLIDWLAKTPDVVVADVDGQAITRGDVAEALAALPPSNAERSLDNAYRQALQGLITQRGLVIRAQEAGIDKDPQVRRRLAASTDIILGNEYLRRMTAAKVTDQAVRDAYNRVVAQQPGPVAVHARIIAVGSEEDAARVRRALDGGMDFARAAGMYSSDPTASRGGDLGYVYPGTVLPEINAVLFSLGPGQSTAYPVRANGALYFIKAEDRKEQGPAPLDAVRGALTQQLARAAAPEIVHAAMEGLPVEEYGIGGKPPASAAGGTRQGSGQKK